MNLKTLIGFLKYKTKALEIEKQILIRIVFIEVCDTQNTSINIFIKEDFTFCNTYCDNILQKKL